jgi:hypothetical protein
MADEPWYLIADMPATSHARERSQLIWRGDRALNETDPGTLARIVDILEFLARSATPARSVASSPEHQTPAKTDPWRQSAPLVAGRWPLPALTARTVAVLAASLRFWYPSTTSVTSAPGTPWPGRTTRASPNASPPTNVTLTPRP